jgi:hypothetical protein
MVGDEAPAATTGGFNGKGNATALKSQRGPASLVAAEIHL